MKRIKTVNGTVEYNEDDNAYMADQGGQYRINGKFITGKNKGDNAYVCWDTTAEWNKAQKTYKELWRKYTNEGLAESEKENMYDAESYIQDESNACDWDKKPYVL
jgi:hypothetical protein